MAMIRKHWRPSTGRSDDDSDDDDNDDSDECISIEKSAGQMVEEWRSGLPSELTIMKMLTIQL